jgi:glycosyltransferase involved in cell wall biosynthesis
LQRVDSARADWLHSEIGRREWFRSVMVRGRRRIAEEIFPYIRTTTFAAFSCCTSLAELRSLALLESADWFIAHTQPALPAAAAAAKRWNAKLGFDCEDLLAETGEKSCDAIRIIEREYLSACDYISATSQCMAEHVAETYKLAKPMVLYNVFPLSLAEGMLAPSLRTACPRLRLHWISQTIGPDRGLHDVFSACSGLDNQIEIHLRGRASEVDKKTLLGEAERYGVASSLHFHPRIDHDELIRTMGEYDVGLALERPEHRNYSLTITNKVFSYMLAGLAILATDTPGQREIVSQVPEVGVLYRAGDTTGLQKILKMWIEDRETMRHAQQAGWAAARSRFCWDIEQEKLLGELTKSS